MFLPHEPRRRAGVVAVCWDVDGTLLRGGTVGGEVLRDAFTAVTGLAAPEGVAMGGMTDRLVAEAWLDLLPAADAAPWRARREAYTDAVVDAVGTAWEGRGPDLAAVTVVFPGVRDVLAVLAGTPGVVQLVVTGNVRAGAELKLAAAGLHPGHLDLDLGAYGDVRGPRANLVHAAREAVAARHGPPAALVVVGDTPRDVEAAHAAGAVAVGVATGSASVDELRTAGADHVFTDLGDPGRLVAAVRAAGEDAGRTTRGGTRR